MVFNQDYESIQTVSGKSILQALTESGDQDFQYLGSWSDQPRDVQTRKALAWKALNKMDKLWKSDLPGWWKLRFFRAAVESILLYGSATWALTTADEKSLDGSYTPILKRIFNLDGRAKISNKSLYNGLPKIMETI